MALGSLVLAVQLQALHARSIGKRGVSGGALLRPREALWLISPVWLLLAAIVLLPSAYILWLSFEASSFGQAARFVGLDNYRQVLADPYFWRALRNTLVVVIVVVHVEVAAGLAIALLFASGLRWRPFWLAVVLAPYAVSEVSAVIMWRFLMEPDVGLITRMLGAVGLPPLDWALSPWA